MMAVRIPTTTRVCLNCKIDSAANAGKEFHEIFDEVGLELQLPFLVKTFFHIRLNKKDKQHLCDDCVNCLIELYDLNEHSKEESCKTNNLKNKPESRRMSICSNYQETSKYYKNQSGNGHKPFVVDQNNTQVNLTKSNYIGTTNFETFVSTRENAVEIHKQIKSEDIDITKFENIEDERCFLNKNRSAPFTQQQNQSSNDIAEDFDQSGERKVLQDFNISIKDEKSDELESNEHMEFISDDENQNVDINKQSNANVIFGSKILEIEEYQIKSNEKNEVLSEIKSETKENVFLYSDQEEFVEENLGDEFINSVNSNSLLEEHKIIEENKALLLNASSSTTKFNNIEYKAANDCIEQIDISDDTCSLEEEYLIEEIILSEGYDQVDLNEYLDKVLITKFQDLQLDWEVECKLCLGKYYFFEELLNHACMAEFEKEQQFVCIIKACEEHTKDLPTLARHLILKHYDKLGSTAINGKCTDCQNTFKNVVDFNKHSCCPNIKRKNGAPNYCKYCDLSFQSFKRYVFHMQFHLKSRRPKICLLCGDLFNNSMDFFEHTQYKHIPEIALACLRCDLFFRDIQVLSYHMELHEDSKYEYEYECAFCPKMYTNKFGLNQHMDIYHNNESNSLQCEYCRKIFGNKHLYAVHIKSHATYAKVQTFICSTCGLITNNMEMIKDHVESDNESPCFSSPVDNKMLGLGYSCENCSLDFSTIKHLKDHRLSDSHSDDLFHCGKCRKSFNTLNHMRNHCKGHKDFQEWQKSFPITKYFVCNLGDCEDNYTTWKLLYQHKKRSHNTEEKANSPTEFKCQFCQQVYSSKLALLIHVSKMHNDARIKCSHCQVNFKSQLYLQKHIDKFHISAECDICLKKITNRISLKIHIKAVHNNTKRYFCKHCQKGYFHKNQRNTHEQKVHPQL